MQPRQVIEGAGSIRMPRSQLALADCQREQGEWFGNSTHVRTDSEKETGLIQQIDSLATYEPILPYHALAYLYLIKITNTLLVCCLTSLLKRNHVIDCSYDSFGPGALHILF